MAAVPQYSRACSARFVAIADQLAGDYDPSRECHPRSIGKIVGVTTVCETQDVVVAGLVSV